MGAVVGLLVFLAGVALLAAGSIGILGILLTAAGAAGIVAWATMRLADGGQDSGGDR